MSDPLERRITDALLDRGLLRRGPVLPPSRRRPGALAVAMGLALFLAGLGAGVLARSRPASPAATKAPAFAIFLIEEPAKEASVAEHRRWVGALRASGHSVYGERLGGAQTGPGRGESVDAITGFFVISARDEAEARDIARSSPHAKQGGRVVVRPIEPT